MIYLYLAILRVRKRLSVATQRIVPQRVQLLLVDESGDLTTTVSWLIGFAVIASVATAVWLNIIAPNLAAATTKTSGLVNSIP